MAQARTDVVEPIEGEVSRPRLVVLDDDPAIGRYVRRVARGQGFEVVSHTCASEFARDARVGDAALLLLDLDLGQTDGVRVLRDLASAACAVPVSVTSGSDDRLVGIVEQIGRSYGLHMAPRLSKPVRPKQIRTVLEYVLSGRERPAERLSTYEELHRALIAGEIGLHYQPKVDLRTGGLVGCEALARWSHPVRGMISPAEFIPIAEQTGLIVPLTWLVLETAARQAAAWRRRGWEARVAVNVPADMLTDLQVPDRVRQLLAQNGLPGGALAIEVTESEVARDLLNAMDVLARLRLMGLSLSVDDFGTGHSSLVKLRDLPFDEVKIDRTFIAGILSDAHTPALTEATIRLGHSLGMRVVAEGVETLDASNWLKRAGCDVAQGYFYGRPVPPEDFAWDAAKFVRSSDGTSGQRPAA